MPALTRRAFLTHGCSLGMASATVSGSLLQLGLARTAAANTAGDYGALVCILLAGGNDSYNMLLPSDADQFAEYQSIRADLALSEAELLPLAGTTADGRQLALHPGMPEVQSLYASGDLAFVANVGTLIEPVDAAAVDAGTARLPLGLFSHSDQIAQWQTALPDRRAAQGWGGRVSDLLQPANLANGLSMNISLSGNNLFQSGGQIAPYAINATGDGAVRLGSYGDGTNFGSFRQQAVDALLSVNHEHLLRREYAGRLRQAIDGQRLFADALGAATPLTTAFGSDTFSASLRQVARTISARDALGANRQTFFITVGGWDHHDEVLANQARMLPQISQGLSAFRDALVELGVWDCVTTFTISDFGRTLTSNGRGSDHGWGGHHMVMGGAVSGGEVYGDYPLLAANSPLDVGRGIYAPTTSVDAYFAELALWLGVERSDLETVLPNVGTFYSPSSADPPLGFLL
ncbi:MAG: DUF1501 domain-containing protein [Pseudomonadota bacterium]